MHLQRVDGGDGEISERREEEAEQEDSGGGDVAERRREVEADEEGDRRCRKYGGDRGGNGRVLGGWAIESARPSHADAKDPKGKGKAMPKESEEQEGLDETDGENEESGSEDGEGESE